MSDDSWAPRAVQEERLRTLERELASSRATIELQIERAALLSALDRRVEAQQAFVEILLRISRRVRSRRQCAKIPRDDR